LDPFLTQVGQQGGTTGKLARRVFRDRTPDDQVGGRRAAARHAGTYVGGLIINGSIDAGTGEVAAYEELGGYPRTSGAVRRIPARIP
jgi:hypothetical protein